jgi:hypothetical protein
MHRLDLDNFLVVACTQGDEEHKHEYYFKVVASISKTLVHLGIPKLN